jgi:integrase
MSKLNATARRVRVERNIYRRPTGVFEVGVKDGAGVQRWRTVDGGITAARALRDELLAQRGRGERVAANPRLRFADAAERYLDGPVVALRVTTRDSYRNAVERHLLPRYATRRLDSITAEDLAVLVRALRSDGLSESTIVIVLGVTNRVYRHAARRLGWAGTNPISLMERSERAKPSRTSRRRVFHGAELEQTIRAATEPCRTMFILAALTGARVSELCGLLEVEVRVDDLDDAVVEFAEQVDRKGHRSRLKTDGSVRAVPLPRQLAVLLARHKLANRHKGPDAYFFATCTGRPLSQRNVGRALRAAQRHAVGDDGRPTFPILHELDEDRRLVPIPRGTLPSMHSYRHTLVSRALLAGESVDEMAFTLGHSNANVTRAIYVQELNDARRMAMRRSRMIDQYGSALEAAATPIGPADTSKAGAEVRRLREAS